MRRSRNERIARKKKKQARFRRFLLTLILLIAIGYFFGRNYYKSSLKAMNPENPSEINVSIPAHSSVQEIANILKEDGLIKNSIIFNFLVTKENLRSKLKAGEYILSTDMNLDDILANISKGTRDMNVIKFTIPEGYEIKQIAEKLTNEEIVDSDIFLNLVADKSNFEDKFIFLKDLNNGQNLEGFLFPSTYEVYNDVSEEEVIEKMLSQFERVYKKDIEPRISEFDLDLNEIVTLASMVEREAKVDKERAMMASVFYNRLKIDMLLQVDATVQYALGERKERLLYKDLEIDSPYNTYLYKGLPPGPISAPGENSIIAAVNPSDGDYLFYVLKNDGSGEHTFTKTYEEHIDAQP